MTWSKKAVPKSSGLGLGEVRKSFRFEGGASSDSVGVGGLSLQPLHEETQGVSTDHKVIGEEIIPTVSLS